MSRHSPPRCKQWAKPSLSRKFAWLCIAALVAAGGCARAENPTIGGTVADGTAAGNGNAGETTEFVPHLTVPAPSAPVPRRAVNVENAYYAQFRLIGRATRALADQRPGIPDLYFIGFAGDASQDVFLRELRSVRSLFDTRFDTARRSLVLINNPDTVAEVPLASTHNLLAALDQVSARMDPDEDVLFLFLTSHGTPGVLAVNFEPLQLNDLTAVVLRSMLDRAKVKWRVIVVSACYSGSFVEPLKNENTLIVTAARNDRVSFGCSHENDFTYFGRAYFDEALRGTHSFVDAFGTARETVARWETEEDLQPSMPQIYVGAAIRPKLVEIERRLQRRQTEN